MKYSDIELFILFVMGVWTGFVIGISVMNKFDRKIKKSRDEIQKQIDRMEQLIKTKTN